MKAVVDTNVVVSGALAEGSPPDRVLKAAGARAFDLLTSQPLLAELEAVLRRPRIMNRLGWSEDEVTSHLAALRAMSTLVEPQLVIATLKDDPDNRVLEAAVSGEAEYIVTGDGGLLALGSYQGILIITPAQFLSIVAEGQNP